MNSANTVSVDFDIDTTDASAKLGVRVLVDHQVVYENSHVTETCHFSYNGINDDEDQEHELIIELFGKLPGHTVINDAGEIVKDAMITVSNVQFDQVLVEQAFLDVTQYHHDFNGTQSPSVVEFFGAMGCNGQARMKFTTPIYLWLLEIM